MPNGPRSLSDPEFARFIGLRYVDPDEPGSTRRRRGQGFSFHAPDGDLLSGVARQRCVELAIPPAWCDVWICPDDRGHIQVIGLDDAGRRQYRYHEDWTEARRLANFDRLREHGQRLGVLRKRLELTQNEDPDQRRRLTAAMVRLVDASLERIGSTRSLGTLGHRGISTLGHEHVHVDGNRIELQFVGKGGIDRSHRLEDPLLAKVIGELDADLDTVWGVRDGDEHLVVTARDANALIRELSRGSMTCKDFRTWGGSAVALEARRDGASQVEAIDAAAEALGNTRAVARGSYIHPDVLAVGADEIGRAFHGHRSSSRYDRRERALLALIESRPPLLRRHLVGDLNLDGLAAAA